MSVSATTNNSYVQLQGISVSFGAAKESTQALRDVSLTVERGGFACIVGPSGCGKTTLLRLIAGFVLPTSGQVLVEGAPVKSPDRHRGMVFQQPALYPWLNVLENVEFGPKMRGVPMSERRHLAGQFLEMVKLGDVKDRKPYELSGGMQQRVAIARVLANDSDMLLMDEPFGALDALTREHLQEELLRIWRKTGKTVVFVTHSVEEAVYLGTSVTVLSPRPGRVIAEIPVSFSCNSGTRRSRDIKADPEFIKTREDVLEYIWDQQ